ncbi:Mov34/MPN/PAD-1 family protein [Christiangramia sp. ASW11-125]|uniref:Mov34/MPN/PAD-1 family protein n=1 Tax=Christiangramia TaxID=292691 RepID=UPI000685AFC2|nr:Mov34/MPN/PAD-1 family protein [Christiangramia portivictoriae]
MTKQVKLGPYTLILNRETLEIFKKYRQLKKRDKEAGGILMGQVRDQHIYINRASLPSSFDKATRHSFQRNKKIAQLLINYEFWNSGKTITYLGEWHTHPEPKPAPSPTDIKMISSQLKENDLQYPYVIQCIIGVEQVYLKLLSPENQYEKNVNFNDTPNCND